MTPQELAVLGNRFCNLERQIAAVDAEIDKRVYKLYGLTEEEIRIVEGKQ